MYEPTSPLLSAEVLAWAAPLNARSKWLCCFASCSKVSSSLTRCSRSAWRAFCHRLLCVWASAKKSRQAWRVEKGQQNHKSFIRPWNSGDLCLCCQTFLDALERQPCFNLRWTWNLSRLRWSWRWRWSGTMSLSLSPDESFPRPLQSDANCPVLIRICGENWTKVAWKEIRHVFSMCLNVEVLIYRRATDLWRAEPCFEMRSLHVLRSSTLLPSVLRADWTSELWEPPPCPGAVWREVEEKSSPESSVFHADKILKKSKRASNVSSSVLKWSIYLIQPACEPPSL